MSTTITRILLVEDEIDIGRIIQLAMRELHAPYTLDFATSADEGMDLWASAPYDLLLTDYNLRGSTGLDLVRFLRAQGHHPPTILFTAYDSVQVQREASALGVDVYLTKPFFMDQLVSTVRELLPHKLAPISEADS